MPPRPRGPLALTLSLAACAAAPPAVQAPAESILLPIPSPRAPDFHAPTLWPEGQSYDLAPAGPPVVLVFGASFCAPCMAELPELGRLAGQLRAAGIDTVLVALDREPAGRSVVLRAAAGSALWVVDDGEGRVADLYGVEVLPTTVLLDGRRRVRFLRMGADPSALHHLRAAVEALRSEAAKSAQGAQPSSALVGKRAAEPPGVRLADGPPR